MGKLAIFLMAAVFSLCFRTAVHAQYGPSGGIGNATGVPPLSGQVTAPFEAPSRTSAQGVCDRVAAYYKMPACTAMQSAPAAGASLWYCVCR